MGLHCPTYNEIRVDTLDDHTVLFDFLSECGRERIDECFGARICCKHGGRDNPAERANIQDQPAFPGARSAEGGSVSKNQNIPLDHPRQYHPRDSDSSIDVDRNNVREFRRLGFRKVHRVRVRLSDVVNCANGKTGTKTREERHHEPKMPTLISCKTSLNCSQPR